MELNETSPKICTVPLRGILAFQHMKPGRTLMMMLYKNESWELMKVLNDVRHDIAHATI